MANMSNTTFEPLFINTTLTTNNFFNFTTTFFNFSTTYGTTAPADVGGAAYDKCYTSNTNIIAAILYIPVFLAVAFKLSRHCKGQCCSKDNKSGKHNSRGRSFFVTLILILLSICSRISWFVGKCIKCPGGRNAICIKEENENVQLAAVLLLKIFNGAATLFLITGLTMYINKWANVVGSPNFMNRFKCGTIGSLVIIWITITITILYATLDSPKDNNDFHYAGDTVVIVQAFAGMLFATVYDCLTAYIWCMLTMLSQRHGTIVHSHQKQMISRLQHKILFTIAFFTVAEYMRGVMLLYRPFTGKYFPWPFKTALYPWLFYPVPDSIICMVLIVVNPPVVHKYETVNSVEEADRDPALNDNVGDSKDMLESAVVQEKEVQDCPDGNPNADSAEAQADKSVEISASQIKPSS